jgi:hypothetical protein
MADQDMSSSSGDATPGSSPTPPAGGANASGGNVAGSGRPSFLDPVPPPTLRNSPELKRLIWLGVGFVLLLAVALYLRPSKDPTPPLPEGPLPVETPEEHAKRIATAFGGALSKMVDGVDFQQSEAYLQIVEEVAKYEPVNFRERTRTWLDWSVAVSTPGAVRGDFVRVRGIVGDIRVVKLIRPAGEVEDVYRFFIGEPDGTEGIVVDLVKRPDETPEVLRDAVDLEGVFIRTLKFQVAKSAKKGEPPPFVEIPYLIGRNLGVHHAAATDTGMSLIWVGVSVVGALLLARMIMRAKPAVFDRHASLAARRGGKSLKELHELHEWQSKIARAREEGAAKRALGTPPPSEPKS